MGVWYAECRQYAFEGATLKALAGNIIKRLCEKDDSSIHGVNIESITFNYNDNNRDGRLMPESVVNHINYLVDCAVDNEILDRKMDRNWNPGRCYEREY